MKTSLLILISSMLLTTKAFSMTWTTIDLGINNIEPHRGGVISIYVFLKEGFPVKHDQALRYFSCDVNTESLRVEIEVPNVPFALKVHHDEDNSGAVSKNWTGFIPAEGLGFSSGAKLGFGPPSFKDAMMTLPENYATEINISYP